jgi:hypothetical protein
MNATSLEEKTEGGRGRKGGGGVETLTQPLADETDAKLQKLNGLTCALLQTSSCDAQRLPHERLKHTLHSPQPTSLLKSSGNCVLPAAFSFQGSTRLIAR